MRYWSSLQEGSFPWRKALGIKSLPTTTLHILQSQLNFITSFKFEVKNFTPVTSPRMRSKSILVLALSAFSSALPGLGPREICDAATNGGDIWTINNFYTFSPASGNTSPPEVYFKFGDLVLSTECSYKGAINGTVKVDCGTTTNNLVAFWDSVKSELSFYEAYIPCNS